MITSISNKTIKSLMKLKQQKYRKEQQAYLVEGDHLVEEARKANRILCLIATKEIECQEKLIIVSKEVMEKLSFTKTPQPIMAKCKMDDYQDLISANRYLLLDGLQDPGNIGTLIRSALAFGIDQVILSNDSVDLYHDKLLRAMQGAHFHIHCIKGDLKQFITKLKQDGVTIIGSALQNGKSIDLIHKQERMAYIVGNEGNGMHQDILDLCDQIAYIPISNMESLNVAVAGSIMMFYFK